LKNNDINENAVGEAEKDKRIVLPARHATVAHNVLTVAHMNLLYKKTPNTHIHEKPGKGGGRFKYVTGAYVKSQLNRLFGFDWSFTVKSFDVKGNQCIVFGHLEGNIRDNDGKIIATLVREQFGRADIKTMKADKTKALDFGNDLKAATTDALKKCASDLGIARDVYAADEYRELAFYDADDEVAMEKEKKAEKYEDKITEIDTAIGDLEELPETKPAEETK
jgi:recombination DNA repair RAD52 pathway protein